jgi:hypothetical protein
MLMRPDLLQGGPAYVDMMPGAMPEQVSMLPFAPEAPAPSMPQPMTPQPSMPSGLGARQNFIDERDMYMGAAPDRFSRMEAEANALANAPQRDPVTGLLLNAQGQQGFQFMTDRGRQAGFGKGNTGFLTADPNAQYRMFDERGKNRIVAEGTGVDALRNIYNTANQFNKEQGKKANWGIERLNPTTGRWERVAENDPSKNILGKIADIGLPIAGALIAGPLGAAAGSGLSSVAQGRSLENTLLRAAITGGATAGFGALGKAIGPVAGSAAGAKAGAAGGTLAGSTLGAGTMGAVGAKLAGIGAPILVSGTAGSALGSALGSAAGAAGGGALGSALAGGAAPAPAQTAPPADTVGDPINVLANRVPTGGALPFASAGAGIMAQAGVDAARSAMERQAEQEREGEPITVTGDSLKPPSAFDAAFSGFAGAATPAAVAPADVQGDPINIKMDPNAKAKIDAATLASAVTGALPMGGILASGQTPTKGETTLETDKGVLGQLKDRLGNLDVADYLRLAGVALPLLDGAGGGGRRGGLSTIPGGMFGRSSVFGGSLPRATMPGASTGFAPRAPSALGPQTTQDYYRYGYGPAQSFFDYVPQGAANTSQAFTGYNGGGMAGDGDMPGMSDNSFAVNGPGTGRSDEIPAMLSDGEYVMDAEFVALLGDGSPKAGADILDQFRINVRKDKGRKLAKGEFSANAKRPEHYLKGGRT